MAGLGLMGSAAYAAYAGPPLLMFQSLEQGQWQFRERGNNHAPVRLVCLGDPSRFIQIAHGDMPCESYVIANNPRNVTVTYKCTGRGHGMTSIRMETGRLIQLRTQGIRSGAPFSVEMEGRRIGRC